jgi:hypothetical protein
MLLQIVQLHHRAGALMQVGFEAAQEAFEVVEETLRVNQDVLLLAFG